MSRQRRGALGAHTQDVGAALPEGYEARLRTLGRTTGYGANLRAFQDSLKDVAAHYLGPLYDNVRFLWVLFVVCGLALSLYLLLATSTTDSAVGREHALLNGLTSICFHCSGTKADAAAVSSPVDSPALRVIALSRCGHSIVRQAALATWASAPAVQRAQVSVDFAVLKTGGLGEDDCGSPASTNSAATASVSVYRIDSATGAILPPVDSTGQQPNQPSIVCPAAASAAAAVRHGKAPSLAAAQLGGLEALAAQCEGALLLAALRHAESLRLARARPSGFRPGGAAADAATATAAGSGDDGPFIMVLRDSDAYPDLDAVLARLAAWKALQAGDVASAAATAGSSAWLHHAWVSDHAAPFLAGEVVQRAARMLMRRDTAAAAQGRPQPPPSLLLTAAAEAVSNRRSIGNALQPADAEEALQTLRSLAHRAGLLGEAEGQGHGQGHQVHRLSDAASTASWRPYLAAGSVVPQLFVHRTGAGAHSGSGASGAQSAPRWPSASLQLAAVHAAPSLRGDWGPQLWPAAAEAPHLLGPSLASFIATAAHVLPAALPLGYGARVSAVAEAGEGANSGQGSSEGAGEDEDAGDGMGMGILGEGARSSLHWSLTRPRFTDAELGHALAASPPPVGALLRRWLSGVTAAALHDPGLLSSAEARQPRTRALGTALADAAQGGVMSTVPLPAPASVSTQLLHMLRPELKTAVDEHWQAHDGSADTAGLAARLWGRGGAAGSRIAPAADAAADANAGSLRTRSGSRGGSARPLAQAVKAPQAAADDNLAQRVAAVRKALSSMPKVQVQAGDPQSAEDTAAALHLAHALRHQVITSGSGGEPTQCVLGRCCDDI